MLGASLGSRVELYAAIRRDARREDLGIRELAARHGVHRRTVRQALASPIPPPRKPRSFPAPRLDAVKPVIDAMLREDLDAPRKQRHTARRVLARLVDEHQLEVSYSSVRDYVGRRRPEIAAEAGRAIEASTTVVEPFIGRKIRVLLSADEVIAFDRRQEAARHERSTEREETASVAIASNESSSGWTKTFTDPRLCAAIVDRLTFAGNIIETGTESYRLAHARAARATT